jgi:nitroreductase
METLDCIRIRRSVRKYLEKDVSMHIIGQVLDAGRMAPTAGNLQNFKFVLVMEAETKRAIADACLQQYWMESAPVHIVVVAEPQKARQFYSERGEKLYSIQSTAAVIENMLVAATDLGIGCCWVGAFDDEMLCRALGIPSYASPQAVITIGYSDEKPAMPNRFKLTDMVFVKKWGAKIAELSFVTREYSPYVAKSVSETKRTMDKHAHHLITKVREEAGKVQKKIKQHIDERKRRGKSDSGLIKA